ncbi:hypothetical protein Q4489_09910 [Thalassotalea sp. 1_MG-2023]|uniref:hypothetical protein n=1 Tax=Thalassotalea sp. 1_MG-2023 TaxID=3062680 RepID=UPI0026E3AE0C|nr:hypothetical protein [Thalassotalea sp. 1_MG-2023]MDO6427329.1 hypothetical protein [Thalassotalea sp. 1_MG-2023]
MLRYLCNKMLLSMKKRYDYDVQYMQEILHEDFSAYSKFMLFQAMASHQGSIPAEPLYAARIRAIIWDDCGSCAQLVVNMAIEAGINPDIIKAIINYDLSHLPTETALVIQFTEKVLTHNLEADDIREQIIALWGKKGAIAIAYAISSSRVYPTLKYALGYGKTCSKLQVNNTTTVPKRTLTSLQE